MNTLEDRPRFQAARYLHLARTSTAPLEPPQIEHDRYQTLMNTVYKVHMQGGPAAVERSILGVADIKELLPSHTFVPVSQLQPPPSQRWLVTEELPCNSLALLYGASGIGKSTLVLNHYALPLARHHHVIYVAAEGQQGYYKRIEAWCQHHQCHREDLTMKLHLAPLSLLDVEAIENLIFDLQLLTEEGLPALIVIDTLSLCLLDGDENSATDMNQLIRNCRRIQQQLAATVLLVHHTGHNKSHARGSYALPSGMDLMMKVSRAEKTLSRIQLTCEKARDWAPFPERHFDLIPPANSSVDSRVAVPLDADLVALKPNEQAVLVLLYQCHTPLTRKDILGEVNLSDNQIDTALKRLKDAGHIHQSKARQPYKITATGKDLIDRLRVSHGQKPLS